MVAFEEYLTISFLQRIQNVRKTYLRADFGDWMRSVRDAKPDKEHHARSKKRTSGQGVGAEEVEFTPAKKAASKKRASAAAEDSDGEAEDGTHANEKQTRRWVILPAIAASDFQFDFSNRNAGRKARGTIVTDVQSDEEDEAMADDDDETERAPQSAKRKTPKAAHIKREPSVPATDEEMDIDVEEPLAEPESAAEPQSEPEPVAPRKRGRKILAEPEIVEEETEEVETKEPRGRRTKRR
jgi:hypothetical protein